MVEVSTRERGILEALLVNRGDQVQQGQEIARLDQDIEQATVELSQARADMQAEISELREGLAFAERENKRIDKLSSVKAVSGTEKDKAATAAKRARLRLQQALEEQAIAKLELERATRLLDNRTIRSPIDGVVVETMMSPGESVENQSIVEIARIDPLYVEIIVPVDFYGAIKTGMSARIEPRYPGAKPQHAQVIVVDSVIDAASDTFGVRLLLPNPDLEVPGGVRCKIQFDDKQNAARTE